MWVQLAQSVVAVAVAGCWSWSSRSWSQSQSWSWLWPAALREVEPSARNWTVALGHSTPWTTTTEVRVDRPGETGQAGKTGPDGAVQTHGLLSGLAGLIKLTLPLTQPMCEGVTLVAPVGAWPGLSWLFMSGCTVPQGTVAQEHGIRQSGLQQPAAAWALSFGWKSKR